MSDARENLHVLGVQKGAALVVPYNSGWADEFAAEKKRLLRGTRANLPVEHVGSTAVPGLAAKPIIDILMGFRDEAEYELCRVGLPELGYDYKGEPFARGDHIFFRADDGYTHTHKVHLTAYQGEEWTAKLAFREYLMSDVESAGIYSQLKTKLAHRFPGNRREYSRGKDNFIRGVLRVTDQA